MCLGAIPTYMLINATDPENVISEYESWGWVLFLLCLNGFLLLIGGKCIMSTIAYPYSSRLFRRNLARTTNEKFGSEFRRSVNRLVDIVEQMTNEGNQDPMISDILQG